MKMMLQDAGWLLAGWLVDALRGAGRALHRAADSVARRTGARTTFDEAGYEAVREIYERLDMKIRAEHEAARNGGRS